MATKEDIRPLQVVVPKDLHCNIKIAAARSFKTIQRYVVEAVEAKLATEQARAAKA